MSEYRGHYDGLGPLPGSGYRDYPPIADDRDWRPVDRLDPRYRDADDRQAARYRDDSVAYPERHSVRVDFDDFDRGGYRAPSPSRM
jgi:hypothetical protein